MNRKKQYLKLVKDLKKLDKVHQELLEISNRFDNMYGHLISAVIDLTIEEHMGMTMEELHFDGDDLFDALYNHNPKAFRQLANKLLREKYSEDK